MNESAWRRLARLHRVELTLFSFTLFAYALSSAGMLAHQSLAPHYVYQADAFLHGQLHLRAPPPNLNDWVLEGGRWYVSFPPLPAVLMAPFVALFGLPMNDVVFTLVFGALNVALFYRLERRVQQMEGGGRGEWEHAAVALLFGFGTLAWSCSIRGEVWFTAEVVGVTFTLLYLQAALRTRHPVLAGASLGCATLCRPPLAFSAVFFVLEAVLAGGRLDGAELRACVTDPARRRGTLRKLALFALPLIVLALPMAWMNWARFGSVAEFGHRYLYANRVNPQIERYGLFSYRYLERNLHAAFTKLPVIETNPLRIGFDGDGMSLFVTTPLFALLLWPRERPRLHCPLWIAAAAIALPGFFYQNTGWYQFGFRFSLDYTPHLFLLLNLGGRRLSRAFWALGLAGVAVNAWGAAVFNRPG